MKDFVLKGNICYSRTKRELEIVEKGYLVCQDGKSAGVYRELPQMYSSFPVVDYGDRIIIPGMVDLHIHAPQFAFRGMSMDLELMDWLNHYTFPEEEKFEDLSYAQKSYAMFTDALKTGATTRAVIFATRHKDATKLLMNLMEDTGLVSYVGKVNMDRESTDRLTEKSAIMSAQDTRDWINEIKDNLTRTKPILTPRFIPCCTDELMEELRRIQMTYGIPVQSHLSENPGEIEFVHRLRPQNEFYGEAYNDYDLFGRNADMETDVKTVMAHCVWSTEKELQLIRKNGVFIAHCPASNLNLSSGIAPIRKCLDMNIRVGLGSDVAGGHSDSIFRAMTDAIQVSKLYWRYIDQNSRPIIFPEAFYMATKGGGAFFGQVGSFEPGYELDAVVMDDSTLVHPQQLTVAQRLERAVYLSLDTKGITAKYVRGLQIL